MISVEQYQKLQQIVQSISAISTWLSPKLIKVLALGVVCVAWFVFYALQFWSWSYWALLPLAILAMPLMILVIWCVLLFDLQELPQALDDIKDSVVGLKERVLNHKPDPVKVVVKLKTARQLPSLLRELFDLAQGVDAINTVVAHVVFLVNPLSWLLLLLSLVAVMVYSMIAFISGLLWLV